MESIMLGCQWSDPESIRRMLISVVAYFTQNMLLFQQEREQILEQCITRLTNRDYTQINVEDQEGLPEKLELGIAALEKAIGSTNSNEKEEFIDEAERILTECVVMDEKGETGRVSNSYLCAWARLNLALLWKIRDNDENATLQILELFLVDPMYSRVDFVGNMWDFLFLPHLTTIVDWYKDQQRQLISATNCSADQICFDKPIHNSFEFNSQQFLRMEMLEKLYQDSLNENTRIYARYYKDCLFSNCNSGKKKVAPLLPIAEPPSTSLMHELINSHPPVQFDSVLPANVTFPTNCCEDETHASRCSQLGGSDSNIEHSQVTRMLNKSKIRHSAHIEFDYDKDKLKPVQEALQMDLSLNESCVSVSADESFLKNVPSASRLERINSIHGVVFSENKTQLEANEQKKSQQLRDFLIESKKKPHCSAIPSGFSSYACTNLSPQSDITLEATDQTSVSFSASFDASSDGCHHMMEAGAMVEFKRQLSDCSCLAAESNVDKTGNLQLQTNEGPEEHIKKPPNDFLCPLTNLLLSDPVTLETGQTYERRAIQEWLDRGNVTCPVTAQNLRSNILPKTNNVLKRLVIKWKQQFPDIARDFTDNDYNSSTFRPETWDSMAVSLLRTSSNNGINDSSKLKKRASQLLCGDRITYNSDSIDHILKEVKKSIACLCTSEHLEECESAVVSIVNIWKRSNRDRRVSMLLTKASVIDALMEVLRASTVSHILSAILYILSDLSTMHEAVLQMVIRADPEIDCIADILNRGIIQAVVMMCRIRPPISLLIRHKQILSTLIHTVGLGNERIKGLEGSYQTQTRPKLAALMLIEQIITESEPEVTYMLCSEWLISEDVLVPIVQCLSAESLEEMAYAALILMCFMQINGSCRNHIAYRINIVPVVDLLNSDNEGVRTVGICFLSELVRLSRRSVRKQFLLLIKKSGSMSSVHLLLMHLQMAALERRPVVAGLLLQLSLLEEPCTSQSMYHEEAIETLVEILTKNVSFAAKVESAEVIMDLCGRYTHMGKSSLEEWLLRIAGFSGTSHQWDLDIKEPGELSKLLLEGDDSEAREWDKRAATSLLVFKNGEILKALGHGLQSKSEALLSPCLIAAAWLTHMLILLPDIGAQSAACRWLLHHFVFILKSSSVVEKQVLAALALMSFTMRAGEVEALFDFAEDIWRPLRQLRKFTWVANELLRFLMNGYSTSAVGWTYRELGQINTSENGEVRNLVQSKDLIFSGHSDGTLKVWDARTGMPTLIQEIKDHAKSVTCLAVSITKNKLYSGSLDRTIRVYDIDSKSVSFVADYNLKEAPRGLSVSSHMTCSIRQGNGIQVEFEDKLPKLLSYNKKVESLVIEGGSIFCGCMDGSVEQIDPNEDSTITIQAGSRCFWEKKRKIYALKAFKGELYSAGSPIDGFALKIWNIEDKTLKGTVSTSSEVRAVEVNDDFIYMGTSSGLIEVWLRERLVRVSVLTVGSRVTSLLVRDDFLFSASIDGKIRVWSLI
eukprot:Gb_19331 [translate_table: standard]